AISLYAFTGQAFDGKVIEILPDTDRIKKSFPVKVRFAAPPEGLQSGMNADVNIVAERHDNALLAPADAIDSASDARIVRDGRAWKQKLKVGVRGLLRAEVLSGVSEGDQLVVAGGEALAAGSRVRATGVPLEMGKPLPQAAKPGASL